MRRHPHRRGVCRNEQPAPILSLSRLCAPANAQSSRTTSDRTISPTLARANEIKRHRAGISANSFSRLFLNFLTSAAVAESVFGRGGPCSVVEEPPVEPSVEEPLFEPTAGP